MTNKYFIESTQNNENIPVYLEQASHIIYHYFNEGTAALIKNSGDLFSTHQQEFLQTKLNFGCIYFNKLVKVPALAYNIKDFYSTIFSFKSKDNLLWSNLLLIDFA